MKGDSGEQPERKDKSYSESLSYLREYQVILNRVLVECGRMVEPF